jgi:protein-S-isoprenylcysteine O-methyltransferase Ste14
VQTEADTHPRLLLPPPVYLGVALIVSAGLNLVWRLAFLDDLPIRLPIGAICCATALFLALWALFSFRAAHTHVEPHKPTTALVVVGPYRFSRNPIYLGFLLLGLGLALVFSNPWGLLMLPLLWAALRWLVIAVEEAFLTRRFGAPYLAYTAQVRRWI